MNLGKVYHEQNSYQMDKKSKNGNQEIVGVRSDKGSCMAREIKRICPCRVKYTKIRQRNAGKPLFCRGRVMDESDDDDDNDTIITCTQVKFVTRKVIFGLIYSELVWLSMPFILSHGTNYRAVDPTST